MVQCDIQSIQKMVFIADGGCLHKVVASIPPSSIWLSSAHSLALTPAVHYIQLLQTGGHFVHITYTYEMGVVFLVVAAFAAMGGIGSGFS